jgi:hypothetical protein
MTYPPQPGQNDPYGQQPQYGQPQYGQPQYGQQQYGQQYPQTGPQPSAYGGFGTYGRPPRKRGPLPWILVGGGALVVAAVVVLVIVLTSGDSAGESPRGTADALAQALNDHSINGINDLMCDPKNKLDASDPDQTEGFDEISNVRVKSVSEPKDDSATAVLTATVKGKDEDQDFPLHKRDGKWCIGTPGATEPSGSGSSGGASAPSTG